MEDVFLPIAIVFMVLVVFPGMVFHYITLWRRQKTLQPDDERIMEDLWRSAKTMERRIETLEALLDAKDPARDAPLPRRDPRPPFDN